MFDHLCRVVVVVLLCLSSSLSSIPFLFVASPSSVFLRLSLSFCLSLSFFVFLRLSSSFFVYLYLCRRLCLCLPFFFLLLGFSRCLLFFLFLCLRLGLILRSRSRLWLSCDVFSVFSLAFLLVLPFAFLLVFLVSWGSYWFLVSWGLEWSARKRMREAARKNTSPLRYSDNIRFLPTNGGTPASPLILFPLESNSNCCLLEHAPFFFL